MKIALLAAVSFWCVPASAAVLHVEGGVLNGASDVVVGGDVFDVALLDGSCDSLFNGCDPSEFAFSNAAQAEAAAFALLEQVLLDSALGNFNSLLDPIVGCVFPINCLTRIPYSAENGSVFEIVAVNATDVQDFVFDERIDSSNDTSSFINANVAKFTRVSVPEPAPLAFLWFAFVALAAVRRRGRLSKQGNTWAQVPKAQSNSM